MKIKHIILVAVIFLVGAYFIKIYLDNKAAEETKIAEKKQREEATKQAVMEMVVRTNALDDWGKTLSKGKKFRLEPILSIELEKLWIQDRPILFFGSVRDVATFDNGHYEVYIKRSLLGSLSYMFSTELQLTLRCPKEKFDSFLKDHPDLFSSGGWNNNVAVIASIRNIKSTYDTNLEGEREDVRIGEGELLDIVYAGFTFLME